MTKINFPTDAFRQEKKYTPDKFSYEGMILICLNKYFTKFLISQIFEHSYCLEKTFRYYLEDFEIKYLGNIADEQKYDYFEKKYHTIAYDFCLTSSKRRYRGIIELCINFNDKDSLEKSYYETSLKIIPEVDLNINLSLLSENNIYRIAQEFLEKMWAAVFKKLQHSPKQNKEDIELLKASNYILTTGIEHKFNITNQLLELLNDDDFVLNDSVTDLYHILFNLHLNSISGKNRVFVTADDILKIKEKKKNLNAQGNRGGFKDKLKRKIHRDLLFLSAVKIIQIQEMESYSYCISFNQALFSKNSTIYPISKKIIEYNPKTKFWQKRIGEYLSFHSHIAGKNEIIINTAALLRLVEDNTSSLKPSILRDNLEKSLDELCEDEIITEWEYKKINENKLTGKDWLRKYKNVKLKIKL